MLIAQRAGAVCQDISGDAFQLWNPKPLVTATHQLQQQMLALIHA
jgi:fructose-1,6-bisphosphatase/inositol monophosphatase family enzyme